MDYWIAMFVKDVTPGKILLGHLHSVVGAYTATMTYNMLELPPLPPSHKRTLT